MKKNSSRPTSDAKTMEPSAPPAVGRVTKENHAGEWVNPSQLSEHARNSAYFTTGSVQDLGALGDDLEINGFKEAVIVTDETCHSGPDVTLRGWRRVSAARLKGIEEVPIIRASGLSEKQEEQVLVRDNLSDLHRRRYAPSERARLAHGLKANLADLGIGVGINPGAKLRQNDVIARLLGDHVNAVKDRETVFFTAYATKALHDAVDAGEISLSAAATLVREVGRDADLTAAIKKIKAGRGDEESERILADAQAALDKQLGGLIAERAQPRVKTKTADADSEKQTTLPGLDERPVMSDSASALDDATEWAAAADEATTTDARVPDEVAADEDTSVEGTDEGDAHDEDVVAEPDSGPDDVVADDETVEFWCHLGADRSRYRGSYSMHGQTHSITVPICNDDKILVKIVRKRGAA